MPSQLVNDTFRLEHLPHIWCPGCGHGILMRDVAQAIENLGLDKDKVCIVSGIGCSSRAAGYMDFNTLHTTPWAGHRLCHRHQDGKTRDDRDRDYRRRGRYGYRRQPPDPRLQAQYRPDRGGIQQ